MPKETSAFISELLSFKNTTADIKKLERAAHAFYKACESLARKREKKVTVDEINEVFDVMDGQFHEVLGSVSFLTNSNQYQKLMRAVEQWHVPTVMELGEIYPELLEEIDPTKNPEQIEQIKKEQIKKLEPFVRLFHVRSELERVLHDVLPVLRVRQQKIALKQECASYIKHLTGVIEKKQTQDPTSPSLDILKKKQQAMSRIAQTLETDESVDRQLEQFKIQLNADKGILATRRYDFTGMTFLKAVATILSLSVAYWKGIWKTEGEKATEKMEAIVGKTHPDQGPSRHPPRRRQG